MRHSVTKRAREQAEVAGAQLTLSKSGRVGRSKGYLWFPTVARLGPGERIAMITELPGGTVNCF